MTSTQLAPFDLAVAPATEFFVAPDGAGNGSSWDDAAGLDGLAAILAAPGVSVINLRADSGDVYPSLSLPAFDHSASPVVIRGLQSDGAPGFALFASDRTAWTRPVDAEEVTDVSAWAPGGNAFEIPAGANGLIFEYLAFERVGIPFNFAGSCNTLIFRHLMLYNVRRFIEHPAGTDLVGVEVHDNEVVGFSKHCVRIRGNSSDWFVHHNVFDSARQSGDNFAVGIGINETAHDLVIEDNQFLNCHDDFNAYKNGDGVSSEENNYAIELRRNLSSGHTDAGFDLKSATTILEDNVLSGNKHGLRLWNGDFAISGGVIGPLVFRGGGGKPSLIGTYTNDGSSATISVEDVELVEDGTGAIVEHGLGAGLASEVYLVGCTYDFAHNTTMEEFSNGQTQDDCALDFDVDPVLPDAPWLNPNPLGTGAVSGTPGTAPTGWAVESSQNGLTRTISVGAGYVDIRYAGTTTGSARIDTHFNDTTDTDGVTGQKIEAAIDMEIIGTIPPLTGALIRVLELDAVGASTGSGTADVTFQNARKTYRYQRELTEVDVAHVRNRLEFTYPTATAIDITFRIYAAGLREWANAYVEPLPPAVPPVIEAFATTDGGGGSTTSYTVAKPAGTVAGDLLIFAASADLASSTATWTSVPAGLTALGGGNVVASAGSTGKQINAWWKIADGSEGANFTFVKDLSIKGAVSCIRISGADPANPIGNVEAFFDDGNEPIIGAAAMVKQQSLQLNLIAWDTSRTLVEASSAWDTLLHIDYSGHDQMVRWRTQADGLRTMTEGLNLSGNTNWVCISVLVNAAGADDVSGFYGAFAGGNGTENVDPAIALGTWKVQLPVDISGEKSGGPDAYEADALGFESPPWFDVLSDGSIRMACPTDGERTSAGTAYARCELREMAGGSEAAWLVTDGGSFSFTASIERQADQDDGRPGRIVIAQVKGVDDERVRLHVQSDGSVIYFDDLASSYTLLDGSTNPLVVDYGVPMDVTIDVDASGALVTVVYDGATYSAGNAHVAGWAGQAVYFKCGNYSQVGLSGNAAGTTGPADGYSSVILHALSAPVH